MSALLLAAVTGARAAATLTPDQSRARDIYKQLIEIDTTDEHGATTPAAEAMAKRPTSTCSARRRTRGTLSSA
jgi:hypothetical protein